MKNEIFKSSTDEIDRKEALKKISKYAALTAMGTFLILNPQKAQASSHDTGPELGEWTSF
jgi:hypothetical protein